MAHSNQIVIRSEVVETGFGLYSDEDIKRISVCRITSSVSNDQLGNPLQGGLYDSRLGPQDSNQHCLTCGLIYAHCPGHVGHIELCVPVYHPLLFKSMYTILRGKCLYCDKFKLSTAKCRVYLIRLKLLEMGDVTASKNVPDLLLQPIVFEDTDKTAAIDAENKLKTYEDCFNKFLLSKNRLPADQNIKSLQQKLIDEFYKDTCTVKKCE